LHFRHQHSLVAVAEAAAGTAVASAAGTAVVSEAECTAAASEAARTAAGGGMRGMGGGMHFGAWAVARLQRRPFRRTFPRMRRLRHGFPERRSIMASTTGPSITGSSITASPICVCWRALAYAAYAAYDGCWRRAWTPYGLQWVNVCGDYYGN
jgi:hypothetical protein